VKFVLFGFFDVLSFFRSGSALIFVGWSMDPDPGEKNDPQKVKKFHALNFWMFSFEG
jgi:hypothetical protein